MAIETDGLSHVLTAWNACSGRFTLLVPLAFDDRTGPGDRAGAPAQGFALHARPKLLSRVISRLATMMGSEKRAQD